VCVKMQRGTPEKKENEKKSREKERNESTGNVQAVKTRKWQRV